LIGNGCATRNYGITLSKEEDLSLRETLETAVRRIRVWLEMAVSLRGSEPGSRRTSAVGRRRVVKSVAEKTIL
jgi:hypothetical protein